MWSGGGWQQGSAYNTDVMINSPRFGGRTRKIITVPQSHGALRYMRSVQEREGGARGRCKVQGLKERRMLRVNGSFARLSPFKRPFCVTLARRRSHSRSAWSRFFWSGLLTPRRLDGLTVSAHQQIALDLVRDAFVCVGKQNINI